HRDARAVKHLGGNWHTPGEVLACCGEVAAALVATPVQEDARHLYAPPHLRTEFAVYGGEYIVRLHRGADADMCRLVTKAGCVGSELACALQIDGLRVEGPDQRHKAVHFQQFAGIAGERWGVGREVALCIEKLAVLDLELGDCLQKCKAPRCPLCERHELYISDPFAPFWGVLSAP